MRARRERAYPVQVAVATIRAAYEERGLEPRVEVCEPASYDVLRCTVRDRRGAVVADSAGKGGGSQSLASVLFEAWEHYWGFHALATLRHEAARALPIAEVTAQPALADDTMLHRLAADFPSAQVGCLYFTPLDDDVPGVWYPVFAKNPACRRYPVPGDDRCYEPYERYATNNGTASGLSVDDALLHALLEVVERDAMSFALLDWFGSPQPTARSLDQALLPVDLAELVERAAPVFGDVPVLLDITSDLGVPTYCAMPPRNLFPAANSPGAGASLSPGYAVERAVVELLQCTLVGRDPVFVDAHRRAVTRLHRWPLHARCTEMDPTGPVGAATAATPPAAGEWDAPQGSVAEQLRELRRLLARRGHRVYWLRWDPDTPVPVVCVLVPGLETFFLARQGVPVLPSGRATAWLLGTMPGSGIPGPERVGGAR